MDSAVLQMRCLNTGKEDRLERSLMLFDTVVDEELGCHQLLKASVVFPPFAP